MKKGFTLISRACRFAVSRACERGFTLIELLVVMSIIGILAALVMTGFTAARKNARDTARKSDLAQYKTALEAYAANHNGAYPDATNDCLGLTCTGNSCNASGCAQTGIFNSSGTSYPIIPGYLPTLIQDPTPNGGTGTIYRYEYIASSNGQEYVLWGHLETGGFWELCSIGKTGLYPGTTVPGDSTCDI